MPTATWERLREAKKLAVLEAAEAEFAARGFSGGSLNTICREAGVSKGSLFQYFDDKADMYAHLAERASRRIRAAMEGEIATLDWERDVFAAFDDLIAAWVSYFYDHPRDLAMTAAVNLEPNPLARAAVRAGVNEHYLAVLSPLIDLGIESGQLRSDLDREAVLAALVLLLPHLALAPHVSGLDPVLGLHSGDVKAAIAGAQRLAGLVLQPHRATPDISSSTPNR
jgi:AcrR family transcriptional regulator